VRACAHLDLFESLILLDNYHVKMKFL